MKHRKTYRIDNCIRVPSNNERKLQGKPMVRLCGKRKLRYSKELPFV